nr:hypothetical protein [Tanacetum cinerariifolium]
MAQNIDFSDFDQIQTPQYPDVHPPSQETSDEVFQANHSVQNEEFLENSSNKIAISNSNQEKEEPPQDSNIRKEFLGILDNVDDLIESALNSKLLLINLNSQRLEKEQQEVKNVVEQPTECGNRITPILSTKEPEHSLSLRYEHLSITPETESDEVTKSNAKNLLPIPSEFYDDEFEDIEYVEALLSNPDIVSVEEENGVKEENVVQQEEEEIDIEDISQIEDVVLREKLLSITRLISNIESLNNNPNPDHLLNSFESDNSLLDNFLPEFETFCYYTEETRSGNTTHADNTLLEYDSFCFEIEPDQERLIHLVKNNISDDSSNDSLLEEADLFLASDNSIPLGIEDVADDSEGDVRFLEELLIDDSILSHESSDFNFEDNPLIPRPPPELPDAETNAGEEITVVMNDKDSFDKDYCFFMIDRCFLYSP